jgi:hypothetical protein
MTMPGLAERLLLTINHLFPPMAMHRRLHQAKLDEAYSQA